MQWPQEVGLTSLCMWKLWKFFNVVSSNLDYQYYSLCSLQLKLFADLTTHYTESADQVNIFSL